MRNGARQTTGRLARPLAMELAEEGNVLQCDCGGSRSVAEAAEKAISVTVRTERLRGGS